MNKEQKVNNMREDIAAGELHRLNTVRKTFGDRFYAEAIGESVIIQMVLLADPGFSQIGERVLIGLQDPIQEIQQNPELAAEFVKGVLQELSGRRIVGWEARILRRGR